MMGIEAQTRRRQRLLVAERLPRLELAKRLVQSVHLRLLVEAKVELDRRDDVGKAAEYVAEHAIDVGVVGDGLAFGIDVSDLFDFGRNAR